MKRAQTRQASFGPLIPHRPLLQGAWSGQSPHTPEDLMLIPLTLAGPRQEPFHTESPPLPTTACGEQGHPVRVQIHATYKQCLCSRRGEKCHTRRLHPHPTHDSLPQVQRNMFSKVLNNLTLLTGCNGRSGAIGRVRRLPREKVQKYTRPREHESTIASV